MCKATIDEMSVCEATYDEMSSSSILVVKNAYSAMILLDSCFFDQK